MLTAIPPKPHSCSSTLRSAEMSKVLTDLWLHLCRLSFKIKLVNCYINEYPES